MKTLLKNTAFYFFFFAKYDFLQFYSKTRDGSVRLKIWFPLTKEYFLVGRIKS